MIVKNYEIKKIINQNFDFYLFYGSNIGLIEITINELIKPNFSTNLFIYDEQNILNDQDKFIENIFNLSFFEQDKLIIINRATDKILNLITEVIDKNPDKIKIIIKSNNLDRKSKLRNFFEKNKKTIIVPFYEEDHKSLSKLIKDFFIEKKIKITHEGINLIVEKVRGKRINLNNELDKIYHLSKENKYADAEKISKLINLAEDYDLSELVNQCLAKNKFQTLKILNNNQILNDDCISIIRLFLYKVERIKKIQLQLKLNQNYESVINSFRPAIFWKEKNIVKQQLKLWTEKKLIKLKKKINKNELLIKKNNQISKLVIYNFIFDLIKLPNN